MKSQRFHSISGFVLAGGESRRMGHPKQQLMIDGETMLQRQLRLLRSVISNVAVVGPPVEPVPPGVEFIADLFPGCGPLGGIHAALAASRMEFNLVVACDLPFLNPRFLRFLAQRAHLAKADITIPADRAHRMVPVCAVYRKTLQGIIRARLAAGLNKADGYFRNVRVHRVGWSEILRAGFSAHIFDNINQPQEFEAALRRLGA